MTVVFTDKEREWLVTEPNNWHIKEGCPKAIGKSLRKKLNLLYGENTYGSKR